MELAAAFALDFWTLVLTFAAGAATCWIATLVWYGLALRAEYRRQREASDRVMSRVKGLMVPKKG